MLNLNYLIKLIILCLLIYSGAVTYVSIKKRAFEDMVVNCLVIIILLMVLNMLLREANTVSVYLK